MNRTDRAKSRTIVLSLAFGVLLLGAGVLVLLWVFQSSQAHGLNFVHMVWFLIGLAQLGAGIWAIAAFSRLRQFTMRRGSPTPIEDEVRATINKVVFSMLVTPVLAFLIFVAFLGVDDVIAGQVSGWGFAGLLVMILVLLYAWASIFSEYSTRSRFFFDGEHVSPTRLIHKGKFKHWRSFILDEVTKATCEIRDGVFGEEYYVLELHLPGGTVVQTHSVDVEEQVGSEHGALESLAGLCKALLAKHDTRSLHEAVESAEVSLTHLEKSGKGRLILSCAGIPEMKRRSRQWSRKYLVAGITIIVVLVFVDIVFVLLVKSMTFLSYLAVILVNVSTAPLAVSILIDAFAGGFVGVYENGLIAPGRSLLQILSGEKENFIPFSEVKAVITNSRTEYPNVAIELADKEILIDKRDIHDLKKFEDIVRTRVEHVLDAPPDDENAFEESLLD